MDIGGKKDKKNDKEDKNKVNRFNNFLNLHYKFISTFEKGYVNYVFIF